MSGDLVSATGGLPATISEAVVPAVDGIRAPKISGDWRPPAFIAYALILGAFGGFGCWAGIAKIESGAVAPGVVAAKSSLKTVQHAEGGVVSEILVRDGDLVRQGQVLFRLDDTQTRAQLDAVQSDRMTALAQEARLVAERDHLEKVVYPPEIMQRVQEPIVARAIADEDNNFRERRTALQTQLAAAGAKVAQLRDALAGAQRLQESDENQEVWIKKQLEGIKQLYDKGFATISQLSELAREEARLTGDIGKARSDEAQARQAIAEASYQMDQLRRDFQQKVVEDILTVRANLARLAQQQKIAEQILARCVIQAPQTGVVQGLKVFTVGGVIRPGDTLLAIAPIDDPLVVQARVRPEDMDIVHIGLRSEIQFPSFHSTRIPPMYGTVRSLSNDRIEDPREGTYYAAEVTVDQSTVPPLIRSDLKAGLPANVMVQTGKRTPLQYLLAPFLDRLGHMMRDRPPVGNAS